MAKPAVDPIYSASVSDLQRSGASAELFVEDLEPKALGPNYVGYRGIGERRETFYLQGSGSAYVDAGAGSDAIFAGLFDDYLVGGGGRDEIAGDNGNDIIIGDTTWDDDSVGPAPTSSGNDFLYGGQGDDTIYAGGGSNFVDGGGGNDQINGGSGSEYLQGAGGDDVAFGLGGNDTILGGNSSLQTQAQIVTSLAGDVSIPYNYNGVTGEAGGSTFGNAFLFSFATTNTGNDYLDGGEGNDNLSGQDGNDFLIGGAGDDVLDGGAGADAMDGGSGFDVVQYLSSTTGVLIDLQNSIINTGEAAGDGYANIEGVVGTNVGDLIFGDGGNNYLFGYAGADQLSGRNGYDSLFGGDGDDLLLGGASGDALNGGNGYDYAHYGDASSQVTADLQVSGQNSGDAAGDTYIDVEGLVGSAFADLLLGNAADNRILGGAGNDQLYGRDGYDALFGGAGNDTLYGGFNADTFVFGANEGQDTIGDFDLAGGDTMLLSGLGVSSFAQLQGLLTQVGANTVITFAGGSSITLLNIASGSLNAGDFSFA